MSESEDLIRAEVENLSLSQKKPSMSGNISGSTSSLASSSDAGQCPCSKNHLCGNQPFHGYYSPLQLQPFFFPPWGGFLMPSPCPCLMQKAVVPTPCNVCSRPKRSPKRKPSKVEQSQDKTEDKTCECCSAGKCECCKSGKECGSDDKVNEDGDKNSEQAEEDGDGDGEKEGDDEEEGDGEDE